MNTSSICTLFCENENFVLECLSNWFKEHVYPALATGDGNYVVRNVDLLWKYVFPIPCSSSTFPLVQASIMDKDPFVISWFLFYQYDILSSVVRIWGGLDFWTFHSMNGTCNVADLDKRLPIAFVLNYVAQTPSRAIVSGTTVNTTMDQWFYIPQVFPEQCAQLAHHTCSLPDMWKRLKWIQREYDQAGKDGCTELWERWDRVPRYTMPFGDNNWRIKELASDMVMPMLSFFFGKDGSMRDDWVHMVDTVLKALFYWRVKEHFNTEKRMFMLLRENGLMNWLKENTQTCTPLDRQLFMKRYPEANQHPPTLIIRSPLENVPPELSCLLPIHPPHRHIHLTYLDLPRWLWYQRERQWSITLTSMFARGEQSQPALLDQLSDLASDAGAFVLAHRQDRRGMGGGAGECHSPYIEDLCTSFPPCFYNVWQRSGRFPKHQQRLRITQTLKAANISLEAVGNLFEEWNDRFPHPTQVYRDASARFNYEYTYKRANGPTYCANIIKDTVEREGENVIVCPYVHKKRTGIYENDDLVMSCKQMCASDRGEPEVKFNGPHHIIRKFFYQRQRNSE